MLPYGVFVSGECLLAGPYPVHCVVQDTASATRPWQSHVRTATVPIKSKGTSLNKRPMALVICLIT